MTKYSTPYITGDLENTIRKRRNFFIRRLLKWSASNFPDYPWRKTTDPYLILVAEMLLRKTRAPQVKDIYDKFVKEFPSLKTLYDADTNMIEDVVRGLGLKYRAAWIKDIVRNLYDRYGNSIPSDEYSLQKGIGKNRKYILNCVRCFAFNTNTAVFDVNVKRILQRVFSIDFGKEAHKDPAAWEIASLLVPEGLSREYNWAMLDLGRLICTARNPKCNICPLRKLCDFADARARTPATPLGADSVSK